MAREACGTAGKRPGNPSRRRCSLGRMRLTVFWQRMNAQFGETYAESVARDFVLAGLGGRTAERALADGEEVRKVWLAVCDSFSLPDNLR